MQNITVLACPERLLVWLICLYMLYSSKHMTGHQSLINSDVSFNNLLLFSCNTVTEIQGYMEQKLIAQNVVQIYEQKAFLPNGLTKLYTWFWAYRLNLCSKYCLLFYWCKLEMSAVFRLLNMRTKTLGNLLQVPAGVVSFPAECVFKIMCCLASSHHIL